MATITCVRCLQENVQMEVPPYKTPLGQEIFTKVCAACWQEWQGMSTMVINEYALNLATPQGRETLRNHMKAFLNLLPTA